MSKELTTPAAPKKSSFLREGWRELGRKLERRKLRGKMTQDDRARNAALASLGQKAWEAGIDLSDFAELSAQIKSVVARGGELAASTQKLEGEKATQEEQRRGEVARFDAQRKTLDDLKRPVDASLREQTQKQSAQDREAKRMESRLAAIAGELAAVEKQAATPAAPGQEAQAAARDAKRQQLLTEQSQLSAALPQAKQALQSLAPEVERLNQESQRLSNEIAKLEAERKAALAHIDATLDRLRGELRATGEQSKAASEERTNRFLQLGRGLYEKKKSEPALAEAVAGVQKAEGELAARAGSLRESLAQTQAMPRETMAKFFVTLMGTPLLIICLVYGGLYLWEYTRPDERVVTPKPVNRYLQHPFKAHPAYVLANQLVEAKSEQEVADRLREALKKIHVGIYTADGHQVLAGAERSQNDFFLYDFQVKMIARAFFLRNGMVVADHTRMLGKVILELEDPTEMEPVFNSVIVQRYHEARQKPDDPMSFLILLVDGLARQQLEPYSIEETHRFSNDLILFDPIQSSLLMIDFFTRPPAPKSPASLNWMPSFVTTAYAQGPCDGILGDEGQGYWGRGFDIVGEAAQLLPKMAGKVAEIAGNVTGVTGAIADLLVLYGMNIKLDPQPPVIHLNHETDEPAGIEALVTFDSQGVPDSLLKCGWVIGKQMPANGPMKDVELKWDFYPDLPPYLEMHSSMWGGAGARGNILTGVSGGLRTTTDENGKSIFLIQRKPCPDRRGLILGRDYVAKVTARYVTKSIPSPGLLGFGLILKLGPGALEYLMNGRTARTSFRAEWHKKRPEKPHY
jgi:predicted  nucleic acid-binding Zn-ribbon protein